MVTLSYKVVAYVIRGPPSDSPVLKRWVGGRVSARPTASPRPAPSSRPHGAAQWHLQGTGGGGGGGGGGGPSTWHGTPTFCVLDPIDTLWRTSITLRRSLRTPWPSDSSQKIGHLCSCEASRVQEEVSIHPESAEAGCGKRHGQGSAHRCMSVPGKHNTALLTQLARHRRSPIRLHDLCAYPAIKVTLTAVAGAELDRLLGPVVLHHIEVLSLP